MPLFIYTVWAKKRLPCSFGVVESKNLSMQSWTFKKIGKFWLPLSPQRGSGAPARIFSIFLNVQLCIEGFFVRDTATVLWLVNVLCNTYILFCDWLVCVT